MTTTDLAPTGSDSGVGARRCVACEHDLADHDAIDIRYCQATQARALPRACVCRPAG